MDRCEIVQENFLRRGAAGDVPAGRAPAGPLTADQAVQAFRAGCLTRALDRQSRAMQRAGQGFYTIGSSGHEGLAAAARPLRQHTQWLGKPAIFPATLACAGPARR